MKYVHGNCFMDSDVCFTSLVNGLKSLCANTNLILQNRQVNVSYIRVDCFLCSHENSRRWLVHALTQHEIVVTRLLDLTERMWVAQALYLCSVLQQRKLQQWRLGSYCCSVVPFSLEVGLKQPNIILQRWWWNWLSSTSRCSAKSSRALASWICGRTACMCLVCWRCATLTCPLLIRKVIIWWRTLPSTLMTPMRLFAFKGSILIFFCLAHALNCER